MPAPVRGRRLIMLSASRSHRTTALRAKRRHGRRSAFRRPRCGPAVRGADRGVDARLKPRCRRRRRGTRSWLKPAQAASRIADPSHTKDRDRRRVKRTPSKAPQHGTARKRFPRQGPSSPPPRIKPSQNHPTVLDTRQLTNRVNLTSLPRKDITRIAISAETFKHPSRRCDDMDAGVAQG